MIFLATPAHAGDQTAEEVPQLQIKLLIETKVFAVAELKGPAGEYKSHGDPNTREIVFQNSKQDGPKN